MFGSTLIKYAFGLRVKPNKAPQVTFKKWRIVRGDTVILRNGHDKGKTGVVSKVYRKGNKVVVDGVNIKYKYVRQSSESDAELKAYSYPVHVSKVALLDPEKKVATRIKIGFSQETGDKIRISKKSGAIIEKPKNEDTKRAVRGKDRVDGEKDTPATKALEVTYLGEDLSEVKKEFEAFIAEKERKEKLLIFD